MIAKNDFKKRIIITGANGYLASNLIKYFSKSNYYIFCIYNKNLNNKVKNKNTIYIKHNLKKKIPLNKIKGDFFALLHFAGPPNDRTSVTNNKKKIMDTIQIDKNTIDFSIKKKIKLFLYASSSAVYDLNEGLKKKNEAFREKNVNDDTNYDGDYGAMKRKTEKYLQSISKAKLNFAICRIFSIYGKNTNTIINIWKKKIIKNNKISIWGNKDIIRSWLHIDDFLSAIHNILRSNKNSKIINIGSNEKTSFSKIIEIIEKKYGKKNTKIIVHPHKYPGPKVRFANHEKINKLGWKQKIYLSNGIELIP
ncbi:NAD(P)-dependent oxidoreductase [Candidatus Pelagibacter sp.]|nr:NAD(P)-dependent oxidoreductase [Candidatus Pelagibacter sp.]